MDAFGQSFAIVVLCADDNAAVGRVPAVQPNKMPAIEGHNRPSLPDRVGQDVSIRDPLLSLASLLGRQHVMTHEA